MALDESAVSALLDAVPVGEGTDLVRELAQWALQQLIEAEATANIGADPWERTEARTTHRNGHRPRVLSTKAGDLALAIPKLRKGTFFPELLEQRRRVDQALYSVVMEAYVNGVSTRAVDDLVAAMCRHGDLEARGVTDLRPPRRTHRRVPQTRPRPRTSPYVSLDATYINVRDDALGQVVSRAVVIATGITATGEREVLGVDIGDSEERRSGPGSSARCATAAWAGSASVISDALKQSGRRRRFQAQADLAPSRRCLRVVRNCAVYEEYW